MIKAKLLAMCVCPAIGAPPAILAVSPPARHAVAHVLHRAARQLDHTAPPPAALPAAAVVPVPCPPAIALSTVATPQLSLSLSSNLGDIGNAAAFAGPSLDRSDDRLLPAPLAARYGGAMGGERTMMVQVAAADLAPAGAIRQSRDR